LARGGPIAVAGDSAGANLGLALALALLAEDRPAPACGLLFYGAYAADTATPSYLRFAEGFGLTRAAMARFWEFYAPDAAMQADPRVSPLQTDAALLRRLPPLFLNAAGLDPLLCDSLALAARLREAGVPHALRLHEGVHHGFMQMSLRLPEAQVAIDEAAAFLRGV
ncbi:alpha/beta hydrolase fold domain-containing protein, partial [Lichenihabitans sp. Uapishka_5]|uniref:alpha/beta hydrolase fold domain-containing protein n=1 Tax=Lichenihabitans sp. Uapishka_5 TaxID=3037302 RepID=UPI0029E7E04F